jgi:hypothetical protein
MSRVQRTATDPATRARALQLAAEVGAAQASRETGVPASTIRAWRARDADQRAVNTTATVPVTAVTSPDDQLERVKRIADKAAMAAESAIDQLQETIGSARSPQSLAIATGVLLDKAAQLQDGIRAIEEQQIRITEEQGHLIAELQRLLFEAIDVPYGLERGRGRHVRVLLADMLRQATTSGDRLVFVSQPDLAEAARDEVRDVFAKRLRPGIEREIRQQLEAERAAAAPVATSSVMPLGLPERSSAPLDGSEEMVGPRQAVVTFSEPQERPQRPSEPDVEIVDAEVVPEVPGLWLRAHHGNEQLARRAWEASLARDREREARPEEPEPFGGRVPSKWRLEGSPGGPTVPSGGVF